MLVFKLKASCRRQGTGLVDDNGELLIRPLIKAEDILWGCMSAPTTKILPNLMTMSLPC